MRQGVYLGVAGAALPTLDAAGVPVTKEHYRRLPAQGYAWHGEERFG